MQVIPRHHESQAPSSPASPLALILEVTSEVGGRSSVIGDRKREEERVRSQNSDIRIRSSLRLRHPAPLPPAPSDSSQQSPGPVNAGPAFSPPSAAKSPDSKNHNPGSSGYPIPGHSTLFRRIRYSPACKHPVIRAATHAPQQPCFTCKFKFIASKKFFGFIY